MCAMLQQRVSRPVLLVALARRYGGSEGRVFDLAKLFHGQVGYTVATLANSPLHQRLQAAGLSVVALDSGRGDPRLLPKLSRLIRNGGYGVVDAHNPQSQWWGLLAGKVVGTSVLVSTVHLAYGRVQNDSMRGWLYEQVLRQNRRWGCRFITVSDSIRQYLFQLGVEKVALIHNAIDMAKFQPADGSLPVWRAGRGWGRDKFVIVMVGRLEAQKGYPFMLEAMAKAVTRCPTLRCVVVGDGRLRQALEQQVTNLGLADFIHFAGFQEDVPLFLRGGDAFCLSSLAEGLPYALLEAAAHRLPLLVTRVDGMAELLTDGENGLLVPAGNPQALSDGLCWLVEHPKEAQQLGIHGHELVRSRFDPARMMAETLSIYGDGG